MFGNQAFHLQVPRALLVEYSLVSRDLFVFVVLGPGAVNLLLLGFFCLVAYNGLVLEVEEVLEDASVVQLFVALVGEELPLQVASLVLIVEVKQLAGA